MLDRTKILRRGFAYGRVLAFLGGFAILFVFLVRYYLIPTGEAFGQASPGEQRALAAYSRLVLAIVGGI